MLLRAKMRRLPAVHQATLKAIIEHLARIVALTEKNKMDAKNLSIAFGGVLFGEDEMPKGGDLLGMQSWKVAVEFFLPPIVLLELTPLIDKETLMEDLITNAQTLFDENTIHHSPPLPPTPVGEPVPSYTYGTSHTKVASVPSAPSTPRATSEDFTPRLPPRPANSIHPSLRANPVSAAREDKKDLSPSSLRSEPRLDDLPQLPSSQTSLLSVEEETESSTLHTQDSPSDDAASQHPRTSSSSPKSSRIHKSNVEPQPEQPDTSEPPPSQPLAG
jgi:hypothetical protein